MPELEKWLLTPKKVMTLNANVKVGVALNAYEGKWWL